MKLEFKNKVFRPGLNTTVRKGKRWHNKQADNVLIRRTRTKRFRDINTRDIQHEHDPECRTYAGLYDIMKKIYKGFNANHTVTIVDFER